MRKRFILTTLLVLALSLCSLYAVKIDERIDRLMMDEGPVSLEERTAFYEEHRLTTAGPFAMNLLIGFGSGSYVQGDTAGGIIGSVFDTAGWGLMGSGFALLVSDMLLDTIGATVGSSPDSDTSVAAGLMIGGAAALVGSRLFQAIRPYSYADDYNSALHDSLYSIRTAIVPYITENGTAVALSAAITF